MVETELSKLSAQIARIKSNLSEELSGIRSGRANPAMVDGVEVEAYGAKMKLRELAHISAPESRLIVIQPWDASLVEAIAKGVQAAGLGLNPAVEGGVIRLPLPPLTEERRAELVKVVRAKLEAARVAIRQARQDSLQALERAEKSGAITEDQVKRGESQIQRQIDEIGAQFEEMARVKEAEVMTV